MAFLATFVGVGKHLDPDIRDLVGATRDAKALHALFLDTIPNSSPAEYGDVRRFSDTTRFHLQSAANILAVLLLGKNPQAEIDSTLKQLEIGIPANALDLLRLSVPLNRGEYLALLAKGISNIEQLWSAPKELLESTLGKIRAEQLEQIRPKIVIEAAGAK